MLGEEKPRLRFMLDEGMLLTVDETSLKCCDLCGALNLLQNSWCFVCGWHGHFTRDADIVGSVLREFVRGSASLTPLSFTDDGTLARLRQRRVWLARIVGALRRWFGPKRS